MTVYWRLERVGCVVGVIHFRDDAPVLRRLPEWGQLGGLVPKILSSEVKLNVSRDSVYILLVQ